MSITTRIALPAGVALAALAGATGCTADPADAPQEVPASDTVSPARGRAEQPVDVRHDVQPDDQLVIPTLASLGGTPEAVQVENSGDSVEVRVPNADLSSLEPIYGLGAGGQRASGTGYQECSGMAAPDLPDEVDFYGVTARDADDQTIIASHRTAEDGHPIIACVTEDDETSLEQVTEQRLADAADAPHRRLIVSVPAEMIEGVR